MTMSRRAVAGAEPPIERLQPWIAALLSALWHLLFLMLLMSSPEVVVTAPQGAAAGSRMVVDFVGVAPPQPAHASPAPPRPRQPAPRPEPEAAEPAPAESRLQTTRVVRADEPVPQPVPRPSPPAPSEAPATPPQAQAPAAGAPPTAQRPAHVWGQPPGMLPEDMAPANAGMARSPAVDRGRGRDVSSSGPSLEVGGYQVLYDQRSEARLRAWKDQGITELFLPLPGTRQYMVCPLETALRRESGPCRLLDPDDPQMADIGDAREVINMQRVYRRGEVVWRGPGPYR